MTTIDSAKKFDATRAGEYLVQSRIALAGYDACHELTACLLAAVLGPGSSADILVVGAGGGGQEIVTGSALEPGWRFTGIDPSEAMMALTKERLHASGLDSRADLHVGTVDAIASDRRFDAATLIGVLHHIAGDDAKRSLLRVIAEHLKPAAPFVLAGNRGVYTANPLFLTAWAERWRLSGAAPEQVTAKLATIRHGADPPPSDEAVVALLTEAGFVQPTLFFSSLFWGAWLARRA